MFRKLIQLDLKFILKTVAIYAVCLLLCVFLHNLTSYDTILKFSDSGDIIGESITGPSFFPLLHAIFYNLVIVCLIGMILNATIRIWVRFKQNFYGDEAYLTHTLPIKRSTLWTAKFCSTLITIFLTLIWIALCFAILQLTPTGRQFVEGMGILIPDIYHTNGSLLTFVDHPVLYDLAYFLVIFLEFTFVALSGITGIIFSQRFANGRTFTSIVFGFAIYIICCIITFCFIYLLKFINPLYGCLFYTFSEDCSNFSFDFITKILFTGSLFYIGFTALIYFVDRKLLERGINLN